eukprot:gnl/TRDRNA2_/TRDRNA2_124467_c1_seq1.p1 gnl/TRDRNA2_/TRDRNA2_124467_c1~~gnl/TRDRNA2_/TRDRNA2_124467_c1_seq1.p1  ORF type:complete len:234 (-),score=22.73 gnl/TRDRNA2_/TRDRNA2_124467_c1_seq1:82-783(-)
MVTMFEITFANWAPICRLLVDNVSQWFGLFFIIYRCVLCFSLLSVITAVFISETMRIATSDKEVAVMKKSRAKKLLVKQLKRIFEELDFSGDGLVAWPEFEVLLHDDELKMWLSTLEIDVRDLELLFKMLDDGDGHINIDEFIRGVHDTMGPAKSSDVVKLLYVTHRLDAKIDTILVKQRTRDGEPDADNSWTDGTHFRTASVTDHVCSRYLTDPESPKSVKSSRSPKQWWGS